ncbi:hypothetical protein [Streptomyces zaomyceticus]|uniref:hypothetical protein n=1 Tax=Streptomyces zaomyceticus TaxID=68286 RepID=UPI00343B5077
MTTPPGPRRGALALLAPTRLPLITDTAVADAPAALPGTEGPGVRPAPTRTHQNDRPPPRAGEPCVLGEPSP